MIRKLSTATVLAAAIVAAPGVASADTNPASTHAHMCYTHPDVCAEPRDNNMQGLVDGAQVVTHPPTLADKLRATFAKAFVDIWRGPRWK